MGPTLIDHDASWNRPQDSPVWVNLTSDFSNDLIRNVSIAHKSLRLMKYTIITFLQFVLAWHILMSIVPNVQMGPLLMYREGYSELGLYYVVVISRKMVKLPPKPVGFRLAHFSIVHTYFSHKTSRLTLNNATNELVLRLCHGYVAIDTHNYSFIGLEQMWPNRSSTYIRLGDVYNTFFLKHLCKQIPSNISVSLLTPHGLLFETWNVKPVFDWEMGPFASFILMNTALNGIDHKGHSPFCSSWKWWQSKHTP